MARFRDWIDLGKNTISSLTTSDVANLYSLEWPETKRRLVAEHQDAIDRDPKRLRRWLRTLSAIFYGMAKRLAPHRRVLFLVSFVFFFVCLFALARNMAHPPVTIFVELAATFVVMTLLLAMELIDKLKYRDELQLARDLQASLIPTVMPQSQEWDIAAFNRIANTVGGDIYDFVPLEDGRVGVLFGDASGHGMAAGLVMAVAHAAFRTQLEVEASPPAIMASLNRILCRTGGSRSFFACCYVLLSPDGSYLATVAGHPPILRIDASGHITERVGRGAYPLGVKTGLTWETVSGRIEPGEKLLFHSDGLTESQNVTGHDFGDGYVEAIAGWHPKASALTLVETIVSEWRLFMGDRAPDDDVSVAAIVRR